MLNSSTLESWIKENHSELYGYVFLNCGNADTAEDLIQETYVKALTKACFFNPDKGTLKNWLYKISTNLVYDHFRSIQKLRLVDIETHSNTLWELCSPDKELQLKITSEEMDCNQMLSIIASLENVEIWHSLAETILKLPSSQKSVVILSLKHSHEEISNLLDIPMGTVKSRLHTARQKLTHFKSQLKGC
jgi:RNA polymerase sigma-70 factor (ECF subfamily)